METSLTASELLDAIVSARSYLVEDIISDDYPASDSVEALAVLTEAARKAGYEPASDIGRRVVLSTGEEGIITGVYNGYTVFIDGEEWFSVAEDDDEERLDRSITQDDFTFVEDSE